MQVMKIRTPFSNQLLTNPDGKREIGHAAAMQVPDLALTNVEEHHAAAVGFHIHCGPGSNSLRIRQTIDSVGIVTIMPLCSTAIQTMPGGFEPKWGESHGESKSSQNPESKRK